MHKSKQEVRLKYVETKESHLTAVHTKGVRSV